MIRFLCLSVQHTGTHFTGATLRHLTGLSSEGWPPPSRGPGPVGFSMRHLYGHDKKGALPWPDKAQEAWWAKYIDGTDLPVIIPWRSWERSYKTLKKRPQERYNFYDHFASLYRGQELVYGLRDDDPDCMRFWYFDVEKITTPDRIKELWGVLHHIRYFQWDDAEPEEVVAERVHDWAERWPVINSTPEPQPVVR